MFDVSVRRFWEPAFAGSGRTLAGWTRELSGLPTISVGSVTLDQPFGIDADDYVAHFKKTDSARRDHARPLGIDRVVELFERGEFDPIAVGRAMLSNPDWANLVRDGRHQDLKPYNRAVLQTLG
jgi:2,4-dienoyl-CoA reductase-like NADH-dependent reductase (Old Yellow Enzyme family)